jgi:hypothetical protein
MRIGRQIEFIRNIQKTFKTKEAVPKYTTIAKNTGLGLWLTYDALTWVD